MHYNINHIITNFDIYYAVYEYHCTKTRLISEVQPVARDAQMALWGVCIAFWPN